MAETLTAKVLVQLEAVGEQFVHARLMSPWSSQVVGRNWAEVEPKLKQKAEKELGRGSPRKWLAAGRFAQLPQTIEIPLELKAPQRNLSWDQPLEMRIEGFRWDLDDGMSLITVPNLACEIFARTSDLTPEVIQEQVRTSLVRMGERFHLLDVYKRFFQRRFQYQLMTVSTTIRSPGNKPEQANDPKAEAARVRKATVTLRSTCSDLSKAQLDPVFGRDQAALEISEYLVGQTPQSILLVGPAGVGKTAIVHRLVALMRGSDGLEVAGSETASPAAHQEAGELSRAGLEELKHRKIWSTTGSRLVSGMSGFGMWQERCLKLIREAHATKAILHVGSIIELMEAGKIEGQPGVASMIRQAIARGRLVIIGECTPEQINLIERDEPLLLRALVRYDVTEPSTEAVTSILRMAAQHRTRVVGGKRRPQTLFTEPAIEELNRLHRRYASYSALPAQPLRLMQTILEHSRPGAQIESADVARAFAAQTGLPSFLVDDSISIDLERIRQRLSSHLIGQSEPIDLVVNLIATLKSRMVRPGRPLASLMFIGPTGVGKTEMAKAIAGLLYSDTRRMVRIDMSEYATPWSAVRLIGRPDEGDGTLTSPIREQPFSVVLLDEFEKADATVFDMLLQLLGEGRLTDSLGRLADFRNAVVIMTSNLGVESFRESGFGFSEGNADWRSHFQREVQRFVRPELLGRIDRIVPFAPLPPDVVRKIAEREVNLLKERPGLKYADVQLQVSSQVIDHLANLGYQPKYGARPLRRVIEQQLCVPLANTLSELAPTNAWNLMAELNGQRVVITSERVETQPGQQRESTEEAIDQWQSLGRMARLAMQCGPLRDLQNETERLQRLSDTLFEKLKETTNARRVSQLKQEIQQNAVKIERNHRVIEQLQQASSQITAAHAQVMLEWYSNQPIDSHRLHQLPDQLQSQLRGAVVALLEGRTKSSEVCTLMIVGRPIARAAVLWQAYEQLAQENHWQVECFTLKSYEPSKDRETPEYRKKQARKPDEEASQEKQPVFRLLGSQPGAEPAANIKTCDVYREEISAQWLQPDPSIAGIALQISGIGVSAWLNEEQGVMHFHDTSANGPKRRLRYRVLVEERRLRDVTLAANWTDPSALPERDPRRTFHLAENFITDGLSSEQYPCGNSKLLDCLLEVIRTDRENQLWQAIDFTGIPGPATLRNNEVAFPF